MERISVAAVLGLVWLALVGLPRNAVADDPPVAHWPLAGSVDDRSPDRRPTRRIGVDLEVTGPQGQRRSAAAFDGVDDRLEIQASAAPRFGANDFTVALWVHLDEDSAENSQDLVSCYDPLSHRGWQLSIKSHAVTSSQANRRTLHFGLANGQAESPWVDHGRLGQAILVYALAVHQGHLYAGTCEAGREQSGRVFRFDGGQNWIDCGAPAPCNSVSSLAVYQGQLYAGVAKYRLAGSALAESDNPNLGGKVFRYDGDQRWVDCGQLPETEAVGGLVVFQGRLYAGSLYKPAGFFRYEGAQRWTRLETPGGKRVEALAVHRGKLWASSYDEAHVYQFDGRNWVDCGQVGDETNTQTYSFAAYQGQWYVGTWRSGKVFRFDDSGRWIDSGRLGDELEVMGMLVHNGRFYAGSLPLANVYRFAGGERWLAVGQLDQTPDVKYRRAWTMAEFRGRLFVGTLPSGRVWSTTNGANVTYDHELSVGWRHVAAVRTGSRLRLYVDGRKVAESEEFQPRDFDLSTATPLRIGFGQNDFFRGRLADVRIYGSALDAAAVGQLAK